MIIGLTGSIATGKSTALAFLKRCGFKVWSADKAVHRLMEQAKVKDTLRRAFPDVYDQGKINRALLGDKVFQDPQKLTILENILHPLVHEERQRFQRFLGRHRLHGVVEIPLLFDTKNPLEIDFVVVTTLLPRLQKTRALKRPHMTEEKLKGILKRQHSAHFKKKQGDFILHSGLTKAFMFQEILAMVRQLKLSCFRKKRQKPCVKLSSIQKQRV